MDPFSGANNSGVGFSLLALRRYDEAIAAARKSIELGTRLAAEQKSPIMAQFLIQSGHDTIERAEEAKGDFSRAIAEFQNLSPRNLSLARAYALTGRQKEALEMVAALKPAQIGGPGMAGFYGAIGDNDKAFQSLEKGYDERPSFTSGIKAEIRLDPLRTASTTPR